MELIRIAWVLAVLATGHSVAQTSDDPPSTGDLGLTSEAAIAAYNELVAVRTELQTQAVTEKATRNRELSSRLTDAQREVLNRALERRAITRQTRRDQLGPGQAAALRAVGGETRAQRNETEAQATDRDLLDTLTRRVGLTVEEARQVMGVLDSFESGERVRIRRWRTEKARVLDALASTGAGGASGESGSGASESEISSLEASLRLGGQLAGSSDGRGGDDGETD